MKYSIRKQFALVFGLLMAGTVLLCWFINNTFLEKYYLENKHEIKEWKELYKDTKWLFVHGNAKEKIQVLSLLGSVKLMFREENT